MDIVLQVMCKVYYFIQAMCYTASVCILTVISIERYVAIIYPIHTRRLHSMCLLRTTIITVWLISTASGLPFLILYDTVEVPVQQLNSSDNTADNVTAVYFCVIVGEFNIPVFNILSLVLWYVLPLCLMSFIYARISVVLWQSSHVTAGDRQFKSKPFQRRRRSSSDPANRQPAEIGDDAAKLTGYSNCAMMRNKYKRSMVTQEQNTSSDNVMTSRRRVIRLLVAVVVSFAACVLPYHIRLIWQALVIDPYPNYWQALLIPSSFVIYYLNSALNPVLYAFLSDKFRNSLYDLVVKRRCHSNNQRGSGIAGRATTGQQQVITLKTMNVNNSTAKFTVVEHSMNVVLVRTDDVTGK